MNDGKKRKKTIACMAALLFMSAVACPIQTQAATSDFSKAQDVVVSRSVKTVIPVGRTVGIKMFSEGLLVVDLTNVGKNESPAKKSGVRVGDFLVAVDGQKLESTEQLQTIMLENGEKTAALDIRRGGKNLKLTAEPKCGDDGVYRLGAWVRDSMAGIGTVTFYDSSTGSFGALGHGITDVDTALLMPLDSGNILDRKLTDIKKGEAGNPGELRGEIATESILGSITCNTDNGVFGVLDRGCIDLGEEMSIAEPREVKTGKATILSNVEGESTQEYEIEITKINQTAVDGRDMVIRVTDKRLLEKTGGIVQGMSGSPIIQNGKIVGAVTHVLVNDPSCGYGIFIGNMLEISKDNSLDKVS